MKPVHTNATLGLSFLFFALSAGQGHAGEAQSDWVETFNSKVRLVSAGMHAVGGEDVLMAGIEIRMTPGWKTYWRVPGDAGLPPSFGWSKSANLANARVMWPSPMRFKDSAGTSIGYHDEVVFPVIVKPAEAGKPVDLALDFDFAICKDICAPAHVKLRLELDPSDAQPSANAGLVEKYLAQVPKSAAAGPNGPAITAMEVKLSEPEPHITVDAKFPADSKRTDLFIEGPPDVFVPLPEKVSQQPDGGIRYKVDLRKGGDPAGLKGKTLTITLISPGQSRETTRRVD
jgi:DsbC/DsbD-like thiol-disulfide interchange protein